MLKTKFIWINLTLLISVILSTTLSAAIFKNRGGEDLETFIFFGSTRELSMGGISVDPDDASVNMHNPALVGNLSGIEGYGMAIPLYLKNTYYFSTSATGKTPFFNLGLSYSQYVVNNIEIRNSAGAVTSIERELDISSSLVISRDIFIVKDIYAGFRFNFLYRYLFSEHRFGVSSDLFLAYKAPLNAVRKKKGLAWLDNFVVKLGVIDLIPALMFKERERVYDPWFVVGLAYRIPLPTIGKKKVNLGVIKIEGEVTFFNMVKKAGIGIEFLLFDMISLRGGYNILENEVTAGCGITFKGLGAGYGMVWKNDINAIHSFSAKFKLDEVLKIKDSIKIRREKKKTEGDEKIDKAEK